MIIVMLKAILFGAFWIVALGAAVVIIIVAAHLAIEVGERVAAMFGSWMDTRQDSKRAEG